MLVCIVNNPISDNHRKGKHNNCLAIVDKLILRFSLDELDLIWAHSLNRE